ncbi:8-amino-7-oxononanoate synthase isoform X3 [Gossypium raimondii]|uniref:8-amino-7-oxononanoate synthase isoform X3 n=1 Tax=Gossypium raimondii TaxID=29730 RepID=UPI00227AF89A|nr:8-amino-7-oxononanoate synthase isoform X3 [Gossypium raimondii]
MGKRVVFLKQLYQDCLLCLTGFSANMALMVALRNLASLIAAGNVPVKDEKIAIFSDELNHASIIDGIRLAERQRSVEFFVYKHCDMSHLRELLSNCKMKKKVVVTDSKRWKQLIQSRGRSFIFSTATPVPIATAGHAAVIVAKRETWRRRELWNRVEDFCALTGIAISSPIISLIVGSEKKALKASRFLLSSPSITLLFLVQQ